MTFANYNPDKMTVTGDSATNAGSHDAVFTLLPGYAWSDNSMTPKTVTWSMAKVAGSISLSKNTSSLDADHLTDAITFTATGEVTVISSDNNNVTAAVSGNAINLTCVGTTTETVTITVNVAASTNYEATSAIITVDVLFVSTTLDDNDWDLISKISGDGLASSYWSVGDAKAVLVNGTVGTLSINQTLYVFILGFNHNSAIEGSGISFGCFKTAKTGGTDVCLCDASYNSNKSDGSKVFNMNHWGGSSNPYNTNYGGWKGCDARYDILGSVDSAPSGYGSTPQTNRTGNDASATTATNPVSNTLMAALPAALRAVMKPITKYTDNKGNSSNAAANVTASVDYLPLLSEFEVQGARSYANENEKNQQAQYAYYANANSKIKYQHGNTGSAALWWCRSAYSSDATTFCAVNTDGGAYGTYSRSSYGLAPAFLV